ncbi:hypothetical protein HDF17_001899 [Granulicella arctica]|uniref:Insertion element IS150 protein InsJ-like helix-turn-helix domain-containing protein n=1 Tax=Granulicella arctica TaxID=940613 RepID=A0A7Y9PGQ4_9BACT|nr:hypothetical protein [Granulicella arctica]
MGPVQHRSATTTEALRRAIQHGQDSMRALARRHGINPKTVARWKKRESTVDRMSRTIKDATVQRYFYDTHNPLKAHLTDFLSAYSFARRLKTFKSLTSFEYLYKFWTREPDRFTLNPILQMPRLNT